MRVESVSFVEQKEYLKPASLKEALSLYSENGDNAVFLAGATDAFVRKTLLRPVIIDISDVGLDTIKQDGDTLSAELGQFFHHHLTLGTV